MTKTDFHMWTYWIDKKGIRRALMEYYADLLNEDPVLQAAFNQMGVAELAIQKRMEQLADAQLEEEEDAS